MSPEVELFDLGDVLVTNKSFYVRHRSYPLQSISAVEVIYHPRNWMPVVASLFAALSFELAAISMQRASLYAGVLVFMLITAMVFWKGGLHYSIALETEAGHVRPMTTSNRILVESLSQVLGAAVKRAHREPRVKEAPFRVTAPAFKVLPGRAEAVAAAAKDGAIAYAAGGPTLVARKLVNAEASRLRPARVKHTGTRRFAVAGSSTR